LLLAQRTDVEAEFGGKPDVGSSVEDKAHTMSTEMAEETADSTINALNDEMDGEHRLLSALGNHPTKHKSIEKKAAAGTADEHDQKMQAQIDTTNKKVADPKGPMAHDKSMKGFSKQLEKATKIKPHDEVETKSPVGDNGASAVVDTKAKAIWTKAKVLMKSIPKKSLQWNDADKLYSAIRQHLVKAIKKSAKKNKKASGEKAPKKKPAAAKPKKQKSEAEVARDAAYDTAYKLRKIANGMKTREHDPLVSDAKAIMDAIDAHVDAHQKPQNKNGASKGVPDHFKKYTQKSGSRPGMSKAQKRKHKDNLTKAAAELTKGGPK